jgi:hypothetical protein
MAGNITYTIGKSVYSTSGSNPLSGSYITLGSVEQVVNENLAAATSLSSVALAWSAAGNSSGDLLAIELLCTQNATIQTNGNGTIGVQTVTIGGTPTGGTFALAFEGQVTAPIAYNAIASAVQTALRALSTIGGTNVTCTGGPLPGTAVTCTFSGSLVNQTVPLITSNIAGLTGGSPTITIANAANTPTDVIQLSANVPLAWDTECGLTCPFLGAVSSFYISCTNACQFQTRALTY